jgi:hypothetical protein
MQTRGSTYIKKSHRSTDFIRPSQKELVCDRRKDIDYEHDQTTPLRAKIKDEEDV